MKIPLIASMGVLSVGFLAALFFISWPQQPRSLPDLVAVNPTYRPVASLMSPPALTPAPTVQPTTLVLPPRVLHEVPFTSQAPTGNWSDPLYQDGCEEASILMAMRWVQGGGAITVNEALAEIKALSDYNNAQYGFYLDVSAADTTRLLREYYNHSPVELTREVTVERIKAELAAGNLLIMPMNGRAIPNNPYTPPGPERHMLLVVGYDTATNEIITNDPGTKFGYQKRYAMPGFIAAVRDYTSGYHQPIGAGQPAMIIIRK